MPGRPRRKLPGMDNHCFKLPALPYTYHTTSRNDPLKFGDEIQNRNRVLVPKSPTFMRLSFRLTSLNVSRCVHEPVEPAESTNRQVALWSQKHQRPSSPSSWGFADWIGAFAADFDYGWRTLYLRKSPAKSKPNHPGFNDGYSGNMITLKRTQETSHLDGTCFPNDSAKNTRPRPTQAPGLLDD